MSHEEPITSHEQSAVHDSAARGAVHAHETAVHETAVHEPPADEPLEAPEEGPLEAPDEGPDEWLEEPEELPRRPRRRLLSPVPLALLGVLLTACGFIGGVLVEKGQTGTSSSSSGTVAGAAARFRALREGTSSTGASSASGSSSSSSGFTRPTAGTVAYLQGSTLYVTNAEGNTVKITTSPATSVTKNVKSSVSAVHPGETVTVTGTTASNGAVSAESITVGSAAGGGLAALFGGGSGTTGASAAGAGGADVERSLFGGGG